jgi:hypothetical protein
MKTNRTTSDRISDLLAEFWTMNTLYTKQKYWPLYYDVRFQYHAGKLVRCELMQRKYRGTTNTWMITAQWLLDCTVPSDDTAVRHTKWRRVKSLSDTALLRTHALRVNQVTWWYGCKEHMHWGWSKSLGDSYVRDICTEGDPRHSVTAVTDKCTEGDPSHSVTAVTDTCTEGDPSHSVTQLSGTHTLREGQVTRWYSCQGHALRVTQVTRWQLSGTRALSASQVTRISETRN